MSLDQILLIPGLGSSSPPAPPSYDEDYQAVLDRATALTYTLPSEAQRTLQNDLVVALKADGIWTKLDIFYLFATDGSAEFATLNWKSPTNHQITNVNAVGFTADVGYTGNGTDSYLDTNFNGSTQGVNYTRDNACRFVWVATDGGAHIDGTSTNANSMTSASSTNQRINQGTSNLAGSVNFSGTGLKAINRTSSTEVECFNDTTQSSQTATSEARVSLNQYILRSNANYSAHTVSAYGIGGSLVAENTDLFNALNTYLAAI